MRIGLVLLFEACLWAQAPRNTSNVSPNTSVVVEQPDAQRVRDELSGVLDHYPPALRRVLRLDPGLIGNQSYMAPYPALAGFLNAHPEIARNPVFYIGEPEGPRGNPDHAAMVLETWKDVLAGFAAFCAFSAGIGMVAWVIRTVIDYRRWNRLSRVQTEVHTKLLDRFSANNDLLAYIQSPAGSRFLQSTPIMLDAGPRSVGAPLARILWSVQGGVVLLAGGIGVLIISEKVGDDAYTPLHALGILGIALGVGFVVSAIVSFAISYRLGLIHSAITPPPQEAE